MNAEGPYVGELHAEPNPPPNQADQQSNRSFEDFMIVLRATLERLRSTQQSGVTDRATGLRDEVDRIVQRYRVQSGDYSVRRIELPQSVGQFGILPRAPGNRSNVAQPIDPRAFDFVLLEIFAWDRGYKVTASLGGRHGRFSFHGDGRAIDVSVTGRTPLQIDAMRKEFQSYGVRIYDETDKRNWTSNTTGYHLHLDTGTQGEVVERKRANQRGQTRENLGIGPGWPLRLRE